MDVNSIINNVENIALIKGENIFSIYNTKNSTMIMLYDIDDYEFVIKGLIERNVEIISRDVYLKKYYK